MNNVIEFPMNKAVGYRPDILTIPVTIGAVHSIKCYDSEKVFHVSLVVSDPSYTKSHRMLFSYITEEDRDVQYNYLLKVLNLNQTEH